MPGGGGVDDVCAAPPPCFRLGDGGGYSGALPWHLRPGAVGGILAYLSPQRDLLPADSPRQRIHPSKIGLIAPAITDGRTGKVWFRTASTAGSTRSTGKKHQARTMQ